MKAQAVEDLCSHCVSVWHCCLSVDFRHSLFNFKFKFLSKTGKFIVVQLIRKTFISKYTPSIEAVFLLLLQDIVHVSWVSHLKSEKHFVPHRIHSVPESSRWLYNSLTSVSSDFSKVDTEGIFWWLIIKIKDPLYCQKLRMNKMWDMMAVGKYRIG